MNQLKPRFRISYLFVAASLIGLVASYAYAVWTASQKEQAALPKLAGNTLLKALRTHHKKFGGFPAVFADLDKRIWRSKRPLDFDNEGRSLLLKNYRYYYYQVDPNTCTLWAIPTGSLSDRGATLYLEITPDEAQMWKGDALTLEEIRLISPVADDALLDRLGMIKQPSIGFKRKARK